MSGPDLFAALAGCALAGGWFGFWLRGRQEKPAPLLERLAEGDIRRFFVTLRPFLRHPDWPTDASVWLYSDGRVHVEARLLGGAKVSGEGESLHAATAAIHRSVGVIEQAIPAKEAS